MGVESQIGDYVYHVQYINGLGELTQNTGVISLIR